MSIEKKRDFVICVLYVVCWIGIGYVLVTYALPILSPFVIAFLITYLLRRPILLISRKTKLPYKWAAVLLVALFYSVVGMLVCLLGVKLFSGIGSVIRDLPILYAQYLEPRLMAMLAGINKLFLQADPTLLDTLERIGTQVLASAGTLASNLSVEAMSYVSNIAVALPELLIKLMLMVISTFFMAVDYDKLTVMCMDHLGEKARRLLSKTKDYVAGTLFVCIRSYLLIMSITFLELSIGLTLLGVEHAWLVAALTAVFDILPVLGTGGVMLPWAGVAAVQGEVYLASGLLVLYLVITVIRNILEPKIVGKQLGLHPLLTLISMFIGAKLLGMIGLFGFPIGVSLMGYIKQEELQSEL